MLLATNYLGLALKNPLVASASPLNSELGNLRRLEDAGAAAVVLPSLFQEQVEGEAETQTTRVDTYAESSPEALSYFPAAVSGPYSIRLRDRSIWRSQPRASGTFSATYFASQWSRVNGISTRPSGC